MPRAYSWWMHFGEVVVMCMSVMSALLQGFSTGPIHGLRTLLTLTRLALLLQMLRQFATAASATAAVAASKI